MRHVLTPCAGAAAAAILSLTPVSAADRAGTAEDVQAMAYQATGALPIELATGETVFREAEISTQTYGSTRLAFDDGTSLTVGPNTEIVIDDFVYNPDTSAGQTALTLTRGALRMISGRIPSENVQIRTPVATVGIRGTEFFLQTVGQEAVKVWVEDGSVVVAINASGAEFVLNAPAFATCSASGCEDGGSATFPVLVAPPIGQIGGERTTNEPDSPENDDSTSGSNF